MARPDGTVYPYVEDSDGEWHRRPADDGLFVDDKAQCRTVCGRTIPLVRLTNFPPDEDAPGWEPMAMCPDCETVPKSYPEADDARVMRRGVGLIESDEPAGFLAHAGQKYLSTACLHELHERCRLVCKFCPSGCTCDCHKGLPSAIADYKRWLDQRMPELAAELTRDHVRPILTAAGLDPDAYRLEWVKNDEQRPDR